MKRRLYVAGPMSGYRHFNYPAFDAVAFALAAHGYEVLNPAAGPAQASWDDYLRAALRQVLDADGLALLDGWEASAGARLEVHVAHQLRVETKPFAVWLTHAPDGSWGGAS